MRHQQGIIMVFIIVGNNVGTTNIYYNHVENTFTSAISTGWTFSGNNFVFGTVSLQADGQLSVGSSAITTGTPQLPITISILVSAIPEHMAAHLH
jgi:hypothetical protein